MTAYIDDDGSIIIRGRSEYPDGQDGRPLVRIGPGEEFEGRTFEEWRALLEADIAREVARWHSLSPKRACARFAWRPDNLGRILRRSAALELSLV